jgi:TonB family protein
VNNSHFAGMRGPVRRAGTKVLHAAAVALLVALTLPLRAADDRPVKSRVAPVYPEVAKRLKVSGEVKLEATVDAQGNVKDVKAISGNHMLEVAAESAVRQWKFAPGDGDSTVDVSVNFTLSQ